MFTGIADYIRHSYKVTSELKSYTVFELVEVEGKNNQLTDLIRIEKFNGKSNATNINDYLRLRTSTSWQKSQKITGLRPTHNELLFYGDLIKLNEFNTPKKTLLIFLYSEDRKNLFIDVYRGFYPNHKGILQNIVNRY
jgi:hypothetical protein